EPSTPAVAISASGNVRVSGGASAVAFCAALSWRLRTKGMTQSSCAPRDSSSRPKRTAERRNESKLATSKTRSRGRVARDSGAGFEEDITKLPDGAPAAFALEHERGVRPDALVGV